MWQAFIEHLLNARSPCQGWTAQSGVTLSPNADRWHQNFSLGLHTEAQAPAERFGSGQSGQAGAEPGWTLKDRGLSQEMEGRGQPCMQRSCGSRMEGKAWRPGDHSGQEKGSGPLTGTGGRPAASAHSSPAPVLGGSPGHFMAWSPGLLASSHLLHVDTEQSRRVDPAHCRLVGSTGASTLDLQTWALGCRGQGTDTGHPVASHAPPPTPSQGRDLAARRGEAVLTHHQGPPGLEPRKQWPVSRAFVPGSSLLGATLRSPGSSAHFAPRDRKPDLWPTQSRGRHKMSP
jgi:hypothetical protein